MNQWEDNILWGNLDRKQRYQIGKLDLLTCTLMRLEDQTRLADRSAIPLEVYQKVEELSTRITKNLPAIDLFIAQGKDVGTRETAEAKKAAVTVIEDMTILFPIYQMGHSDHGLETAMIDTIKLILDLHLAERTPQADALIKEIHPAPGLATIPLRTRATAAGPKPLGR